MKTKRMTGEAIGAAVWLVFSLGLAPDFSRAQDATDSTTPNQTQVQVPTQAASATTAATAPAPPSTLPSNVDPNSPLAQVIRLAQSGVDESIILAYINGSGVPFYLTSDQIIYLKDLGLPDEAITAIMLRDQQLGVNTDTTVQPAPTVEPVPPDMTAQPVEVTQNYFYDTLSPYGNWVGIPGYGLCWQPVAAVYDPNWQPYCDHGCWVYTDCGWYWYSDYAWGGTAFHYGRWFRDARRGWCWWPETTWGPSWVTWRYAGDYCGWAPLPPLTLYRPGVGLFYHGVSVVADFDFGLRADVFTFVASGSFTDSHLRRFRVGAGSAAQIYSRATVVNNFGASSPNRGFFNGGIAREQISAATRTVIPQVAIRETSAPIARGAQWSGGSLFVNRPQIQMGAASSLNQGYRPSIREVAPRPLIVYGHVNAADRSYGGYGGPNPAAISMARPDNPPIEMRGVVRPQPSAGNPAAWPSVPAYNSPDPRYLSPRQQAIQPPSHYSTYDSSPHLPAAVAPERPETAESHAPYSAPVKTGSSPSVTPSAPASSSSSQSSGRGGWR